MDRRQRKGKADNTGASEPRFDMKKTKVPKPKHRFEVSKTTFSAMKEGMTAEGK